LTDLLEVVDLHTEIPTRRGTVQAVDGVSLRISAGETVGLVGESGSGKTMTGMSIMRLLPNGGRITGGSVKLNGQELTSLDEAEMGHVRGNKIGVVFQDPMTALNPTMTVGEQIAEPVQVHLGAGKRTALTRAVDLLELVGMPKPQERLNDYPYQLSGGLRQRAVIAMALACDPDLLIADEPTTALDVSIQAQILRLLDDLVARMQMGMLLITHDMGVVAERTDRVMVMYAGQIVEVSDTWTLFNEIRHPYAEALLDSIPHMEVDRGQTLYSIPGMPPDLSDPPEACRFAPRCRYAQEQCLEVAPAFQTEGGSHSFACFFPVRRVVSLRSEVEVANRPTTTAPIRQREARAISDEPISVEPISDEPISDEPVTASDDLVDHLVASSGADGVDAVPPPGTGPLLVVDHVVKQFPIRRGVLRRKVGAVQAVSDVSLEVRRGETLGLVGESGSGKTTLGRLIMALEKPDSGSISFDGEPLATLKGKSLRRKRRKFQFVFQDPYSSLDPRMRVLSILREPLASQRVGTKQEQIVRIEQLLHEVGLSASAVDLYPHQFSGGQRQRIGLARALVLEPRLIVADEPVSALDVSIQSQVLNLMKSIQAEHSLTYIVISHDLSVVRYLADRIGVMYLGKLVEVGSSDDVYRHPAHPYTAGLLASVPSSAPAKVRSRPDAVMAGELPSASDPPSGCRFRTRCPRAAEICAMEEPRLHRSDEPGHQVACHFPLETPIEFRSPANGARAEVGAQ
jgi:peptide/nickel transport system ATP-binding protein